MRSSSIRDGMVASSNSRRTVSPPSRTTSTTSSPIPDPLVTSVVAVAPIPITNPDPIPITTVAVDAATLSTLVYNTTTLRLPRTVSPQTSRTPPKQLLSTVAPPLRSPTVVSIEGHWQPTAVCCHPSTLNHPTSLLLFSASLLTVPTSTPLPYSLIPPLPVPFPTPVTTSSHFPLTTCE